MPEVSIIAGAYNLANCYSFHQSIQSILDQTYTDFEFILCDDGSTDGTWDMLKEYAQKDERIKLLKNEVNLGLAATLNKCIQHSRGKFIARHDCDDYCDKDRLLKQTQYLKGHPEIAMVGCNAYLFDQNGVWGERKYPQNVQNKDFLFTSPYQHGSIVFRRSALLKAGGYRVAKETYRAEDYDLFMEMQTFCKGANLQEFLYYFCEDENAQKRRKYHYRIDEARVRLKGYKKLGLMPLGMIYVIKPLVVGLIPVATLNKLKDRYCRRNYKS